MTNIKKIPIAMLAINYLAIASSQWGVARFLTDSIALIALFILVGLPWLLLKKRINPQPIWAKGNALSDR